MLTRIPACLILPLALFAADPLLESELIFPPEKWHNHSSSLVELPGGEIFAVWYHGSGERTADDVIIEYARKSPGRPWTSRRTLADTPGFPDCNPAVFLDSRKRLWLFWPTIIANEWHTALLKARMSTDYKRRDELPRWDLLDSVLFQPFEFAQTAKPLLEKRLAGVAPDSKEGKYLTTMIERTGDKYFSRMGWMPRAHPLELPSGRILLPLYSDGYDFSLIAYTDDGGVTWKSSRPIVGDGNVQPSIVRKKDGTLVAYFRDNGSAPKRLMVSESKDDGITWSEVRDSPFPNPGAGAEIITLKTGEWVLINNDLEKGRHLLSVMMSADEGKTWPWTRHLEKHETGSYHYPSIIQAADGTLHATYSHFTEAGKSIKHARFNIEWIQQKP